VRLVERLERLLNLVIALRETRRPLTAAEIRERVAGYGQPDDVAFRRMFERDKADLRALGVPLETAPVDAWGDRHGYRIDPARYDLPDVELAPEEITALAVAVQATGVGETAAGGLRKLAVGAGADERPPARVPVEVGLAAPALDVLAAAQVARTPVRFAYRKAHEPGTAERRTVDPYALVHRRGRWYLVGRDHDRDARRAFRLDRIADAVELAGAPGSFAGPDEAVDVTDVLPAARDAADAVAEVGAAPDVAWLVARAARGGGRRRSDGWSVYDVPVGDGDRFLRWVLSLAPDVEVLSPDTLRAAVRQAAARVEQAARR
jgi:predicted DNA-binding transcriptional regulator YafY